jgi:hypothetical protein
LSQGLRRDNPSDISSKIVHQASQPKIEIYMKVKASPTILHKICIVCAISVFGVSQKSQSASLVQTQSFSLQNGAIDLTFNRFNPALGTLTSVTTSISYTRSGGYLGVDNEGASTATVNFSHRTNIIVDDDNLVLDWSNLAGGARLLTSTSTRTITTLSGITVGADSDASPDYAGSDYYRYDLPDAYKTSSGSFLNISQFEGSGDVDVPVDVSQSNTTTGAGALAQNYLPSDISGSMTITYNYDAFAPIPEPNAVAFAVISISIGCCMRRRGKSS